MSLPYGSRSTHWTYGHKTYEAHRVSHALNEPRAYMNLHLTGFYRVLMSPPCRSDGRVHYRTSQWLYVVYGLETTQIWPTVGYLETTQGESRSPVWPSRAF